MASIGLVGNSPFVKQGMGCNSAYRLASIGLVGNSIDPSNRSSSSLAYRLASIGLVGNLIEARFYYDAILAYRLASIGLVGNAVWETRDTASVRAYRLASIGLVGNDSPFLRPIPFSMLTDWLRSDLRLFVRMCRRSFLFGGAIGDGLVFGMERRSGPTQKSRSNEEAIG